MRIRCGHCRNHHESVEQVQACSLARDNDALPPVGWFRPEEPATIRFLDGTGVFERPYLDATNPLHYVDLEGR